jgi:transketolase
MIICHNMIGKGVSFMEGNWHWHHGAPTEEQLKQAFGELDGVIQE